MKLMRKQIILVIMIAIIGIVLGRAAVRGVMNLLLGGVMFGGNFL